MRFPVKIRLSEATQAAFYASLPLTGFSLVRTEEVVRAFAPSLFLSLPFLACNATRPEVYRSPVLRSFVLPCAALALAALASILLNMVSPAAVLVHTPDMVIQEPAVGLPLLERYGRLLYSLIVVSVTAALVIRDEPGLRRFCHSYIAGYSLGAVFGLGQFLADIAHLPFWTPFGGASWMLSGQTTDYGFKRVNGGAPEPSHWAPFTLMAMAFLLMSAHGPLSRRRWAVMALAAFNLIFSLSGSAAAGLAGILVGMALYRFSRLFTFKIRLSHVLALGIGLPLLIGAFILAVSKLEVFDAYFGQGLLTKLSGQNASGAARLYIMVLTWLAFLEHPIYGVGVGTMASINTFLTLLGSGGVLLFLPYAYLVGMGGRRTFAVYRRAPTLRNFGWYAFYWSMLFVTSLSYGEIFSFFSWLWIALCFARKPPAPASEAG
jgi:hypothetical protein